MEVLFYMIFFFIILIPLVLGIFMPILMNHNKATSDIINYDSVMRKFVYKVPLAREEIIRILKTPNAIDTLSCSFDFEKSTIVFSEYGSHNEYYFHIEEHSGFSILKLEQTSLIVISGHIPYKLNPFMVSKLQAEIVPFSQYRF